MKSFHEAKRNVEKCVHVFKALETDWLSVLESWCYSTVRRHRVCDQEGNEEVEMGKREEDQRPCLKEVTSRLECGRIRRVDRAGKWWRLRPRWHQNRQSILDRTLLLNRLQNTQSVGCWYKSELRRDRMRCRLRRFRVLYPATRTPTDRSTRCDHRSWSHRKADLIDSIRTVARLGWHYACKDRSTKRHLVALWPQSMLCSEWLDGWPAQIHCRRFDVHFSISTLRCLFEIDQSG